MSDEAPDLLVERDDVDVVLVTLNRPRAKNTVSFAMWEAFALALTEIEADTPPRALVVCGAQGHFSNGGDVKNPPARGEGALARAKRLEMGQRVIARLAALPVPTIAAVQGGAWGVSWGLALACDMLIAGQGAVFGAPFVNLGLTPDGGVAWYLTRQLGHRRAAEILYSGRIVSAQEAFSLGLVSRLVSDDQVIAEALAFARGIGEGNRHAVELTKRMIHQSQSTNLAGAQALELAFCHLTQGSEEAARAKKTLLARAAARRKEG
jgi:2-(1,2-epoxy-1,2-dihydrophenyl)acetyl-CoA isomerase